MEIKFIKRIINCTSEDFTALAQAGGGDLHSFYKGTDFSKVDLRGEDLRGICLDGCSFFGALINEHTLVDKEYEYLLLTRFGYVSWFNLQKGYGFVREDGSNADVFIHITAVEKSGLRTLSEGDRVVFRIQEGNKGKKAVSEIRKET